VRKAGLNRTINDLVEDLHLGLIDKSPEYAKYLDATWDEQAVEGSLAFDNSMAALLIRDEAKKRNVQRVVEAKGATIVKALNIVLRRYGASRNERKHMLGGEIVAPGNGD
jgi:hypothetical protein